jgi:hypothetical protein
MSIIYIHGVKVRDPAHGARLEKSFQRWLAPALAMNGISPEYIPVYWGDAAAKFRWELECRPRTQLLKQGGSGEFPGLGSLREASPHSPLDTFSTGGAGEGPVLGQDVGLGQPVAPPLSSIPHGRRPDFLADLYLAARPRRMDLARQPLNKSRDPLAEDPFLAPLAAGAASVAASWDRLTAEEATDAERAARLLQEIEVTLAGDSLLRQGGFEDWMIPDAVSTVFAELRPALNEFVSYFIGDVLAYLHNRDGSAGPGQIPRLVLGALKQAHERKKSTGERIVVITHSMGGQLLFDAVSFFAPADRDLKDLEIDHWISCGAQVSFFAELGLFKGQPDISKPQKLQRPANVMNWTNYYDTNDLVGFVMQPVFDGVTDREYDTGYGLAFAHSGFLGRPSFFEAVADRIGRHTL